MATGDEALWQFPCEFPIKVIGADEAAVVALIDAVLAEHAPASRGNPLQTRPSRNGRYVSFTLTITAESREQLDEIYRALSGSEHVLFAL